MKRIISALLLAVFILPHVVSAQTSTPSPAPTEQVSEPSGPVPQTGVNVTLSPTFLSLISDPGKKVSGQFKVRNNNNFTENFKLSLAKFEAAEGGERPLLVDVTSQDDFIKWISFDEQKFSVGPNESKTVTVTLNVPKTATLGYYYAILVNRVSEKESEGSGAVVAGSPAILTLLEVRTPNAKRELQLEDFSTTKLFFEYLPTEFTIKVKNTGNIHVVPVGDIFIDQGNKKDIAVIHINEGRGNVLPQSARTYTSTWTDGFAVRVPKEEPAGSGQFVRDDKGNTKMTVKYDFAKADRFRIGKYDAHLLLAYDNGERDVPLEATVSFWVIPWKILGITLIILLFVLYGIKSIITAQMKRFRS
ncbi:MAG: Fn3-like domain-containing protein [Candidatus Levybacteria bacterium]|nr:Fn3-like domain-containing protein [Candidatus Levybacteria bacterium]